MISLIGLVFGVVYTTWIWRGIGYLISSASIEKRDSIEIKGRYMVASNLLVWAFIIGYVV